jgi:hypothetical protein
MPGGILIRIGRLNADKNQKTTPNAGRLPVINRHGRVTHSLQ